MTLQPTQLYLTTVNSTHFRQLLLLNDLLIHFNGDVSCHTYPVIFSVLGLVPNLMLEKRRREFSSHCLTGTTSYSLLQREDDYQ